MKTLIETKSEALFEADMIQLIQERDETEAKKMALKKYHQVNLIRILSGIISAFGLVYYILNNQPNAALLMLATFASGHLFNISKP